jgi:hypothetical protein
MKLSDALARGMTKHRKVAATSTYPGSMLLFPTPRPQHLSCNSLSQHVSSNINTSHQIYQKSEHYTICYCRQETDVRLSFCAHDTTPTDTPD